MDHAELAATLERRADELGKQRAVTGFDAFVDEMISVVETRLDLERFERVATIGRFGELVTAASGQSSLREAIITSTEPGGCAVNTGDGLAALGVRVDTFATLGEPIHAAFAPYGCAAALHSWGPSPGRTLAFEFDDGKLMFSNVRHLAEFTAEYVSARLQDGAFVEACDAASVIALTDWTLYPHMTEVWRHLAERVFAHLTGCPAMLIDLVDPSGRSDADLLGMLEILPELGTNTKLTLSLNQNEANRLARIVGVDVVNPPEPHSSVHQSVDLRQRLAINEVVLHAHRFAAAASNDEVEVVTGAYTSTPLKSTGAGDRFNAGYAAALLLGLEATDRLTVACATSGAFVRLGRSATLQEVAQLLRQPGEWSGLTTAASEPL